MSDTDSITTLSSEDALTLECCETDEEMHVETQSVESLEDDEMDIETEEDEDWSWPSDDQIAAWEEEDAQWRNPDAYWNWGGGYDPNGEI